MFDIKQLDNAYNPQEQLLIALGVHPDQQAAKETVANAVNAPVAKSTTPADGSPAAPATPQIAPIARPNAIRPVNLPMPSDPRTAADQAEVDRLNSTGSGISQIHNPFLRGLARVGDIAGSALFPSITAQIPGTELHHRELLGQAEGRVNQDIGSQARESQIAHTQAETNKLINPETAPKEEEWSVLNGMTGPNGEALEHEKHSGEVRDAVTKQPVTAIKIAPKEGKEGELPLGDRVPQLNDMLTERYQVLHPGKGLPKQYAIPQNATQKDYDRIDKALEAEERAVGTKAQQDTANAMRQQALALTQAGLKDREKNASRQDVREHDKAYVQPAEAVEKSYQMMDHAYQQYKDAKAQGKDLPTGAESMVALSTHLSTTFGNVKGARITKDMIEHHLGARSISDSALVAVQKLSNGDVLSPDQWEAFHDLIKHSRDLSWKTAAKEAQRKDIPIDFLPEDLSNGATSSSSTGQGAAFRAPAGAPAAPAEDGHKLKQGGKVVAVSKGGQWVAP